MSRFSFTSTAFTALLLLQLHVGSYIPAASAVTTCSSAVSDPIKATIDKGALFSSCASVRLGVNSLFDALRLPPREFLLFCRSPSCAKPVKSLLSSIPTDCFITYQGSARNLSAEVSSLYRECAQVVGAADQTDVDDVYRYFLD
ncbi:unnamed protein product [Phytophthora fragariaefolia]|uniref:Elicitin n=1 Tax=Phytophthora fragariaefolia TaxID=1490495 RepID=A0A9W6Y4Z0_9STRA|nr:unnamed protein product [Phytophthora fragariaefolia]